MTELPGGGAATTPEPGGSTGRTDEMGGVRRLLAVANRRLLGDTIAVADEDWRAASRLPDWTRGHVATHLARNADALARLAAWARSGERQEMYPQPRDEEIEAGAGRDGLELQTDLDTSAGRLEAEFELLAESGHWDTQVEFRHGVRAPAMALPLLRLTEVVIHHVDLDLNFGVPDIESQTAEQCLRVCAVRLARRDDFPALDLITEEESSHRVGGGESAGTVRGPSNLLLGWVTGRSGPHGLTGDLVEIPDFG